MSYRIYPVTKVAPVCEDYLVKINGVRIDTNTARVSAVPFNRRWPGHQRQIEQSEAVQFLSLATDEPLCFEITPREPFEAVKIRPQSQGITPTVEDGTIRFVLEKPAYVTVEPYGRHRALHIFADPMPHYDVDPSSPDVLYFGPGEHDVGLLELKSHQTLFLDEGAVVYACVRAIDAEDIRIPTLAAMEHLSTPRYNARFKEQLGISPTQYLLRLRMGAACDLLKNTELSVKEIATMCGYRDPYFFSRAFKAFTGSSPRTYRQGEKAGEA